MHHFRMPRLQTVFAALLIASAALTAAQPAAADDVGPAEDGSVDTAASLSAIDSALTELLAAARAGDYVQAESLRLEAYEHFEALEPFLENRDAALAHEIEDLLWGGSAGHPGLATLINMQAHPDDMAATVAYLQEELAEVEDLQQTSSLTGLFAALKSMGIIVREGLEAVLIIGAILGYMRTTRRAEQQVRWVYGGVLAALALSLVTWWVSQHLLTITAASREIIEGVTSLVAVAVLFYVTNWLFHRVYVVDWMTYIKQETGKALATGSALGLAGLGFAAVYREGLETVLFYQALLFDAEPLPVLSGLALGTLLIVGAAFAILRLSKRLPIKLFFSITGALMVILAFNFTGSGVHELQEAGVIGMTTLSGLPQSTFLKEAFGIYPTLETTAAQGLFLIALAVTFLVSRWQWKQRTAAEVPTAS
ncbi:MAG: hypothetical protein Kow00124_21350 [Anaerolineae bacterium]